jgi:hypothetical protein
MKKLFLLQIIIMYCLSVFLYCSYEPDEYLFVAFWNVENLFDTVDDAEKNDEDFLPTGIYEWDQERLERKMYNLARVIRSMNDNKGPDILGVCEAEHVYLLDSMANSFLSDLNYTSVGLESPDNRGIDNALMFKSDKFKLLSVAGDTVKLTAGFPTRLILYVNLLNNYNDTLHIFVNHFPSRRGGQEESEINRIETAQILRNAINQVFNKNSNAKIIVMGDFNDEPSNTSILNTLGAVPFKCDSVIQSNFIPDNESDLFNTSYESYEAGEGTFMFRGNWNMLDQIIISRELLIGNRIMYKCSSFQVYNPEFTVTQSGQFKDSPFPSYGGRRYLGGYSDHFAVTSIFKYFR